MLDLFGANGPTQIPPEFGRRQHPLGPIGCYSDRPIPTNRFYANLLLGDRDLPAYPLPYRLWWSKDPNMYGIAISHTTASQKVFGPDPNSNPAQYYFNPVGIISLNFGAKELQPSSSNLECRDPTPFSIEMCLKNKDCGTLSVPLVAGMGLVTGNYEGSLTPVVQSAVGIAHFEEVATLFPNIKKFRIRLHNNVTWVLYAFSESCNPCFCLQDANHIVATSAGPMTIQCGVLYEESCESIYDLSAGCYAVSAETSGTYDPASNCSTYRIEYCHKGESKCQSPLIFALPHHVASFSPTMQSKQTRLQLDSCVNGPMTACLVSHLEMVETCPDIGFLLPYQVQSRQDIEQLRSIAITELNQDMVSQTSLDSMYFSGKGLDKFAFILLVTKFVVCDDSLTQYGIQKLIHAFAEFVGNRQKNPLCYDEVWGGLVSTAGFQDAMADFGNTYYNDHHFHYGYFVHAAAVIALIDSSYGGNWLERNRCWVDALVQDYANPSGADTQFPISRSFDWFHGHSWAKGLFASADGKDEESSSEDYHSVYAIKLWGQVTGNGPMEHRANLCLAIMKRSVNEYMLFRQDSCTQPKQILKNYVSGILFENKIDHATYFGLNPEYIHGIHMIPTTPVSPYMRNNEFNREEWDGKLRDVVRSCDDGWKGILTLHQANFDAQSSYAFFQSANFEPKWLDGGMSRTWSLYYSSAMRAQK